MKDNNLPSYIRTTLSTTCSSLPRCAHRALVTHASDTHAICVQRFEHDFADRVQDKVKQASARTDSRGLEDGWSRHMRNIRYSSCLKVCDT